MKQKIAITLDEQLVAFLDLHSGGNRSEYLNRLLVLERKRTIEDQLIKALQEEYSDPDYLAEIQLWDTAISDGLDNAEG
jgi:Arc/MetJ-type ribon-helix-helix transcriptional regulator